MPWKEIDRVSLRKEFAIFAQQPGADMSALCRQYGISRPTGYKWLERYIEKGEIGLEDRSREPLNSPMQTPNEVMEKVVAVRTRYPRWGGRKIHQYLKRRGEKSVPAPSTIQHHLKKKGLIQEKGSTHSYIRFEREVPNELWQMDFKGHFAYEGGRCHPLTILDDHSRFSIGVLSCKNERGELVKSHLTAVFKRYGLPKQINVDNGSPWGALHDCARYTGLSVWLIELGIQVSYSAPYHPQTNGKIERFHRTLKEEVITPNHFRRFSEIQHYFDSWRESYNLERPHEALDYDTPAQRYSPSYRKYRDNISEYEYAGDYQIKRPNCRGRIVIEGRTIYVGTPFTKRHLGIRNTLEDGKYIVYYRHQELGTIDLALIKKHTAINLYSGRVLDY